MNTHAKINYIEFQTNDLLKTKRFFTDVLRWEFVDYGPAYSSFSNAGIDGGFYTSSKSAATKNGSPLVVMFSDDLEDTQRSVEQAGGTVVKDIFEFPGGRRFHFTEPGGNELAFWSNVADDPAPL